MNVFVMSLKFWARKSPPWEFQKVGEYGDPWSLTKSTPGVLGGASRHSP